MAAPLAGVRAVVFDAYGTLLDVASAAERTPRPAGRSGRRRWPSSGGRSSSSTPGCARSMGRHADFWQVTGDSLDYALDALRIATPDLRRPAHGGLRADRPLRRRPRRPRAAQGRRAQARHPLQRRAAHAGRGGPQRRARRPRRRGPLGRGGRHLQAPPLGLPAGGRPARASGRRSWASSPPTAGTPGAPRPPACGWPGATAPACLASGSASRPTPSSPRWPSCPAAIGLT